MTRKSSYGAETWGHTVKCDCVLCTAARFAENQKIPQPKRSPGRQSLPDNERLVQIQARVLPDLHTWFCLEAPKRGLTLSQFVAEALEQYRAEELHYSNAAKL